MRLSIEEVEHIAQLARLTLTDEEKRQFADQLSEILAYAARLDAVDTEHIPPTASLHGDQLRLREDVTRPGLPHDVIMNNAPETKDGQFKVPPVFGKQDA